MPTAVDYSFARPGVAAPKAAGVVAVGRYITGAGKAATAAEIDSYVSAGIVSWFVAENTATDANGGWANGYNMAAQAAWALGVILGPAAPHQPRYFAVDENVDPHSTDPAMQALFQETIGYFVGISRVTPPSLVGCYGNGALLNYLGAVGLASWFWQSNSTSYAGNGTTVPAAHIQQKFGGSPLADTDLDVLLKGDVGQYPRPVAA